jgi:GT2 family glycosyltransferase
MHISVVIVSWNAKAYLAKCIKSVLSQRMDGSMEVVVVDNASSDGSPAMVAETFPTVKVIRNKENVGFAKANNLGIIASRGEYLFLINSDVVVSEGCFSKMVEFMNAHPHVGIASPKIVGSDGRVQRSCMGDPSLWSTVSRALALDRAFPRVTFFGGQLLPFWAHDETRSVEVINGCFWMVRRSALQHVGLLDERFFMYGEDLDWCRRFRDFGWDVVFFSGAEALHYGGASSANAPVRFYLEMQRANYQYFLKHHSRLSSFAFLLINFLHHAVRALGEGMKYPFLRQSRNVSRYKMARCRAAMKWVLATLIGGGETSEPSNSTIHKSAEKYAGLARPESA